MTIHHDKLAYGKLAAAREDLTDERILEMLGELEEYAEDGAAGEAALEGGEKEKKGKKEKKEDENAV